LRSECIGDSPACAVGGFDGVENRHVIRVAHAFESVMLDNRQVTGCKALSAIDRMKGLIEKLEILRESPLSEALHGFCQRPVSFQRHVKFSHSQFGTNS
jgi:hypothetical protein